MKPREMIEGPEAVADDLLHHGHETVTVVHVQPVC